MELKLFVATKGFIERDGKILLIRESPAYTDGTNAAKYGLPGGRISPGEHLEEALSREVLEETGLRIEALSPFFADESLPRPMVRGEEWQIIKIFFACRALPGEIKLSEDHDAHLWIDPKEYRAVDLIANEIAPFEAYVRFLERS